MIHKSPKQSGVMSKTFDLVANTDFTIDYRRIPFNWRRNKLFHHTDFHEGFAYLPMFINCPDADRPVIFKVERKSLKQTSLLNIVLSPPQT
jgi:hypothetical protein